MASILYACGRWAAVHRWRVLGGWILVTLFVGLGAATLGQGFRDSFTLPGSESQNALSSLQRTFPELSGASAQMVVKMPQGSSVRDRASQDLIERTLKEIATVPGVERTISPYDELIKGSISSDNRSAISQIQFDGGLGEVRDTQLEQVTDQASALRSKGATVEFGGSAFATTSPPLSVAEGAGLLVAFIVLLIALGAVLPALLPLITAVWGVAITAGLIFAASGSVEMSPTTPLLALMIGLAVGIDYALFVLWRHREELAAGAGSEEAAARAVATAGSAVVFAGLTVMIALAGLAVVGIPFLGVMGLMAAGGVGVAVLVTLTLLPALLGFAGNRVARRSSTTSRHGLARRWVRAATHRPLLTIAAVIVVLGFAAWPARDLALALPDNGVSPAESTERKAYDLISKEFGPGYNSPLLVQADILQSTDPLGLMRDLASDIAKIPGVELIALATPNRNADTGVVQLIPTTGADDPATADLVKRLRSASTQFERDHGVETSVTGQTALQIDVSAKLFSSLLPFGILVVGLSLVLLTAVFRSLLIPMKAAVGYLLSVGAALGAVVTVFQWGWLADVLHVERVGPMVSFLPIILMGVLFGLAMDYEVFLVSRMKEEYARTGDARRAITDGFVASSTVVTAAAVIMIAVFVAFVPEGNASVKPIALGLAVGVAVDAFVVRMIFVPAVLRLFGSAAWRIPARLDSILPVIDIEGEGLRDRLALEDWPADRESCALVAEDLAIGMPTGRSERVSFEVDVGQSLLVVGSDREFRSDLMLILAGRRQATAGRLRVADHLLPYEAGAVRAVARFGEVRGISGMDSALTVKQQIDEHFSFEISRRGANQSGASVLASIESAVKNIGAHSVAVPSENELIAALDPLQRALLAAALATVSSPKVVIVDLDLVSTSADAEILLAVVEHLAVGAGATVVAAAHSSLSLRHVPAHVVVVDLDAPSHPLVRPSEMAL